MKNRVVVEICGEKYTIIAEENEEYVKKTAELVNEKLKSISSSAPVSQLNALALTALNLADEAVKAHEATENMRNQMKNYLEDASRLRSELNEAKREITRLRGKI